MVRGLIALLPVFKFGVRKVAWMVMAEECEVSGTVVCVVLMNSVEMSSDMVKVELVFDDFGGNKMKIKTFNEQQGIQQDIQQGIQLTTRHSTRHSINNKAFN